MMFPRLQQLPCLQCRSFAQFRLCFSTTSPAPSSTAPQQQSPAEYCLASVRKSDHEHFLTNLLLPKTIRGPAFAIRAFSGEIAGVRDSVSEKQLGLMRMQFWRDTIEKLYRDPVPPRHPVALQLHTIIKQHSPTKELFLRIISAREHFLSDRPFDTLEQVESYGEMAFSSVYLLLLELMENRSGHLKHAATSLGKCEGLVTLLRAAPHNASKRRVYLPLDIMMEQDLSAEQVIRGIEKGEEGGGDALRNVVEIVATRAQEHLNSARLRIKFLTREDKLLLLPAVAVDAYLDKLSKCDCNIFDGKLGVRNSLLPASLYYHKFRGSY